MRYAAEVSAKCISATRKAHHPCVDYIPTDIRTVRIIES